MKEIGHRHIDYIYFGIGFHFLTFLSIPKMMFDTTKDWRIDLNEILITKKFRTE